MNLKWYYWYFKSAIPEKICDDIVRYGKEQDKEIATTGNNNKKEITEVQLKNIQKKRKSDVVWMSDRWIYNEIQPYIYKANENAGWNFEWDRSEPCQFTEYKLRKLSMTVSLTNPEEYEGGDLEFDFRNTDEGSQPRICEEIRKKGSVIVFPSFVWHRVKPVTKGTRHSLVCWNLGYPYK